MFHIFNLVALPNPNDCVQAVFRIVRAKIKTLPKREPWQGNAEKSMDGKAGTLVAHRGSAI